MNWDEIKEIENSEIGFIGHHSHTHEYLIDMSEEDFVNDIETATKIFEKKLGYVPSIFSYPFGEYSLYMKNYISKKNKLIIAIISGSIWIFFRTQSCYSLLPRKSFISILIVSLWIYLNNSDPLFLPLGLLVMIFYMYLL